jgi:hypothetical protein
MKEELASIESGMFKAKLYYESDSNNLSITNNTNDIETLIDVRYMVDSIFRLLEKNVGKEIYSFKNIFEYLKYQKNLNQIPIRGPRG